MTIVFVSGYNEPASDMRRLVHGKSGKDGLAHYGYECLLFPQQEGRLRNHIDRFAGYLENLRKQRPEIFPIATLGYSAGGLVTRGFLRAYPERTSWISHTLQVGTPNAGCVANYLRPFVNFLRYPDHSLEDLDVASPFMTWLNGTSGHWVPEGKRKVWRLDRAPDLGPPGTNILCIAGRVPSFGLDDGIVDVSSATLDGAMPHRLIEGGGANHLNMMGLWHIAMVLIKRFAVDDATWKRTVAAAHEFYSTTVTETMP